MDRLLHRAGVRDGSSGDGTRPVCWQQPTRAHSIGAEMRESRKMVSLASALAALGVPVVMPSNAGAVDADAAPLAAGVENGLRAEVGPSPVHEVELMSFTVHQTADGIPFPQHSSHSSHVSHSSHSSSSPGYGVPDWPSAPDVPNTPYIPSTPYIPNAPDVPEPGTGPGYGPPAATTAPPVANTADPVAVACARAGAGLGLNDIANELQRTFALGANDAASIARQALTAVLTGGSYCYGTRGG